MKEENNLVLCAEFKRADTVYRISRHFWRGHAMNFVLHERNVDDFGSVYWRRVIGSNHNDKDFKTAEDILKDIAFDRKMLPKIRAVSLSASAYQHEIAVTNGYVVLQEEHDRDGESVEVTVFTSRDVRDPTDFTKFIKVMDVTTLPRVGQVNYVLEALLKIVGDQHRSV